MPPTPVAFLRDTAFFGRLDDEALEWLASACQVVDLRRGEVLFRQGDPGDAAYVVVHGRVGVWVEDPERRVGEVGAGECLGEMAVLREGVRSATARAERDSRLLRLAREDFRALLHRSPEAVLSLALLNMERLTTGQRQGHARPRALRSLALLPLDGEEETEALGRRLAEALGRFGPTLLLSPSGLDPSRPDDPATVDWLNQQEAVHDTVLYRCQAGPTPWTLRCLRQADRLLVVGRARWPRPPGPAERFWEDLRGEGAGTMLVLLHESWPPRGTADWLRGRTVDGHHHLRLGHREDAERLARFLAGRAVTLVLGGGGARGLAHVGALQALRDRGHPVDATGGTSMGSLVAALNSLGCSPEEILAEVRRIFVDSGSAFDYTLPLVSLIAGRRVRQGLERLFGDRGLEDLPLPCFVTSADLSAARQVVHRFGPVARWVRASGSIPGVAPPVVHEGHLLVDGAVLENLPAVFARGLGWGPVVAVSVDPGTDLVVEGEPYERPLALQLWDRLNPFRRGPRVPGLPHILVRSATLSRASALQSAREVADLYVHAEMGGYGMFDWARSGPIVEAGYRAMEAALEASGTGAWSAG